MAQIKTKIEVVFNDDVKVTNLEFDAVDSRGMWVIYTGTSKDTVKYLVGKSRHLKQLIRGMFCYLDKDFIKSWDIIDVVES